MNKIFIIIILLFIFLCLKFKLKYKEGFYSECNKSEYITFLNNTYYSEQECRSLGGSVDRREIGTKCIIGNKCTELGIDCSECTLQNIINKNKCTQYQDQGFSSDCTQENINKAEELKEIRDELRITDNLYSLDESNIRGTQCPSATNIRDCIPIIRCIQNRVTDGNVCTIDSINERLNILNNNIEFKISFTFQKDEEEDGKYIYSFNSCDNSYRCSGRVTVTLINPNDRKFTNDIPDNNVNYINWDDYPSDNPLTFDFLVSHANTSFTLYVELKEVRTYFPNERNYKEIQISGLDTRRQTNGTWDWLNNVSVSYNLNGNEITNNNVPITIQSQPL